MHHTAPVTYPQDPSMPGPPTGRPRKMRLALGISAAVIAALAGGALAAYATLKPGQPAAAVSVAAEPTQFDDRAACGALVPLLDRAVGILTTYATDRTIADRGEAQKIADQLETLHQLAPNGMRSDVGVQAAAIAGILSGVGFSRDYVVSTATSLLTYCKAFATK